MSTTVVAPSLRKLFVLTLALGILGAGLLSAPPPAEAKKMSCLQKYRNCQVRCAKYGGVGSDGWYSCHNRTCAPQHDNCAGLR